MPRSRQPEPQISLKLSQAQRKVLAEIAPELAIVRSWRHLVAGKFYTFRELKGDTVELQVREEGGRP